MSANRSESDKTAEKEKSSSLLPVVCSECSSLALANLNGIPMCWNCLYAAVKNAEKGDILEIVPLANL